MNFICVIKLFYLVVFKTATILEKLKSIPTKNFDPPMFALTLIYFGHCVDEMENRPFLQVINLSNLDQCLQGDEECLKEKKG